MTWLPPKRDAEAERAKFIAIYGEELWNQIQAITEPKPLASREVMRPRRHTPVAPPNNDRPALQTEDSGDPAWWEK